MTQHERSAYDTGSIRYTGHDDDDGFPVASVAVNGLTFIAGLAVGVGLAYMLDPSSGRRRRQLLRDKSRKLGHQVQRSAHDVQKQAADTINRAQGAAHELKASMTHEDVGDRQLRERVRSELGHVTKSASEIEVRAHDGKVTLIGTVAANEHDELIKAVRDVRGVSDVQDELVRTIAG